MQGRHSHSATADRIDPLHEQQEELGPARGGAIFIDVDFILQLFWWRQNAANMVEVK